MKWNRSNKLKGMRKVVDIKSNRNVAIIPYMVNRRRAWLLCRLKYFSIDLNMEFLFTIDSLLLPLMVRKNFDSPDNLLIIAYPQSIKQIEQFTVSPTVSQAHFFGFHLFDSVVKKDSSFRNRIVMTSIDTYSIIFVVLLN